MFYRKAVDDANNTLLSDPNWNKYQLPYWRLSFDILVLSAGAWETFRSKSFTAGINEMMDVVELQRKSWSPEVSYTWDSFEQLAEMYLIRNLNGDTNLALSMYEQALKIYPNRFNSLAGAAKCADKLNDDVKASKYYGELLTLTDLPLPTIYLNGFNIDGTGDDVCSDTYTPTRKSALSDAEEYFLPKEVDDDYYRIDLVLYLFTIIFSIIVGIITTSMYFLKYNNTCMTNTSNKKNKNSIIEDNNYRHNLIPQNDSVDAFIDA